MARKPQSDAARRSPGNLVPALVTTASMIFFSSALAQENGSDTADEKPDRQVAEGILPQLGVLLQLPEDYRAYGPEAPIPPDEHIEYDRMFPIWGEELINRGYRLPLPIGVSIIGVHNTQDQTITDLNLVIGKGAVPPPDEELRPFPAVSIETTSITQSAQIKADVWILPFLNVFGTIGKVTGEADLKVNIDLANAPTICVPNPIPTRPPICSDNTFSGSFLLPIKSKVDRTTATLGLTGAYSISSWFAAVSGSYTDSYGEKASDVNSINAGLRVGRRLFFRNGTAISPFIGISYLDINTRVQGAATLKNAFSDGDDLIVPYDVQLDNTDKYSGILGFDLGFKNGKGIQFEWNKSANSERFVLAGNFRF